MDSIKENVSSFYAAWRQMETAISDSFTQILNLEIAGKTPEELLQKVVEIMESKGCCNHNIYCHEQAILIKVLWKFKAYGLWSKTFNISRDDI